MISKEVALGDSSSSKHQNYKTSITIIMPLMEFMVQNFDLAISIKEMATQMEILIRQIACKSLRQTIF